MTATETAKKPRPLGKIQSCILRALKEHRGYYPGCGWIYTGHKTTTRYLDQLVARGLATAEAWTYTHPIFKTPVTVTRYKAVQA
jgi:hypothetical protein